MKSPREVWFLLVIGLLFTVMGVWMTVTANSTQARVTGLSCAVFFGLCTFTFGHHLLGARETRLHALDRQVTIAPGVKLPMKRGRLAGLGWAILLVGVLAAADGYFSHNPIITAIGVLFALAGLLLLALLALGLAGNDYLLFEPEGLRLGDRKGSVLLTWENIGRVLPGEYQNNQVLCLWARDPQALARTAQGAGNKWKAEGILKGLGKTRAWQGCDWMIFTGHYGLNATLLARAVATYVTDPKVRAGLEEHLALNP